jgi:hypothetical protein
MFLEAKLRVLVQLSLKADELWPEPMRACPYDRGNFIAQLVHLVDPAELEARVAANR